MTAGGRAFEQEELEAAIEAISDPAALREAQDLVMRATPGLQGVLAAALEHGGWFSAGHEQAVREAVSADDAGARLRDVRTLLAEETRLGMFVGVAVGIRLAQQLGLTSPPARGADGGSAPPARDQPG